MNETLISIFKSIVSPLQGSFSWVNFLEIGVIAVILFILYKKFIQNTQSEKHIKGLFFII